MGWTLAGVLFVQRQSDKGLPTYEDSYDAQTTLFQSHDTFMSSDGEELVPLSDGTFRSENEHSFARYRYEPAANDWMCQMPDGTTVRLGSDNDSRIEDGGHCDIDPSGGMRCSNSGRSCQEDQDCRRTYRWYVSSVEGPNGNRVDYGYVRLGQCATAAGPLAGKQCRSIQDCNWASCEGSPGMVYLKQIAYTLHSSGVFAGAHEHVVALTYEPRPDAFSDFRSGFEVRTGHRLRRVDVCTIGASANGKSSCGDVGLANATRDRAYVLEYDEVGSCENLKCERGLVGAFCQADTECVAGAVRLASVTVLGADNQPYVPKSSDQRQASIPPTRFRYTNLLIDTPGIAAWDQISGLLGRELASNDGALVDLDADGLPDYLDTNNNGDGGYAWRRNLGPDGNSVVRLATPVAFQGPPERLSDSRTQLADLDGDGITDLLARPFSDEPFKIFAGTRHGSFETIGRDFDIDGYDAFVADGFALSEARFDDVDFDKRVDVIRIPTGLAGDNGLRVRRNTGASLQEPKNCGPIPEADFTSKLTALADMNGDRMLDIVVVSTDVDHARYIKYYPAVGRGGFGQGGYCRDPNLAIEPGDCGSSCGRAGASVQFCLDASCGGDPVGNVSDGSFSTFEHFFWEDLTNDGLSDLVHIGISGVTVWVNMGGQRLKRVDLPPYPNDLRYNSQDDVVRFADVDGNGTTDIIIGDATTLYYFDVAGPQGVPPDLLTEISSGIGAATDIDYKSDVEDDLAAEGAGQPWHTRSPFPVTVVARRTVTMGLDLDGAPGEDRYVTDYDYRDAYYDGYEKQFRGFGEVAVIDRGDASQPTLVTRYHFHTGAPDGVDNDGDGQIDQRTDNGGAEEESLKGKILEVRRETCADGNDGDCREAGAVFSTEYERWEIRRLYTPTVCSGQTTRGCCSDADCAGSGSCVPENSGAPGAFAQTSCIEGKPVRYAVRTGVRTAIVEKGESSDRKDLFVASDYDGYGNQIAERNWGVVDAPDMPPFGCVLAAGFCGDNPAAVCGRDQDCGSGSCVKRSAVDGNAACIGDPFNFTNADGPGDERFTTSEYAVNTTNWLVDRPMTSEVSDEGGHVEARSRFYYDDLPLGQVEKGNLTRREEWLDTENRWLPRVQNSFDDYGNIVEVRDARGDRRTLDYDPGFETYPVAEHVYLDGYAFNDTAHAGTGCAIAHGPYTLNMTADYHEGFGVVTHSTSWGRDETQGPATDYEYDPFGRLVVIAAPGDSLVAPTKVFEYHLADPDASGLAAHLNWIVTRRRETVGGGTVDSYQYIDGLGRKLGTKEEGDAPDQWIFTGATSFNARGAEYASRLPYFTSTKAYEAPDPMQARVTKTYDALGRIDKTINPATESEPKGSFSQMEYRPLLTDTHDEDDTSGLTPGAFVTHKNDGLGRLVHVVERNFQRCGQNCGEYETQYAYDARGNLTAIVDAQGNTKQIAYDSLSRKTFVDDPDRGRMSYEYDDVDNVTCTLDAKGQYNVFTYDGANRLLTENYIDHMALAGCPAPDQDVVEDPIDVTHVYDLPSANLQMGDGTTGSANFTEGYTAAVCDRSGEEDTSYDARRRIEWKVKEIIDPLSGARASYPTRFEYDSMDRPTLLIYPDLDRLRYAYAARGLLESIRGDHDGRFIVKHIASRPSGQIEHIEYGNGVVTSYGYDARLRPSSLLTAGAGATASQELIHYVYDFDPVSNIRDIDDLRPGVGDDPHQNTQHFKYDDLHRLTQYKLSGPARLDGAGRIINYLYDKIGNMVLKSSDIIHLEKGLSVTNLGTMSYGGSGGTLGCPGRAPGESPGPHALTSTSGGHAYQYDDDGNMVCIDGMTASWDHKDRLIHLDGSEMTAEYSYDYSDRRITKKVVPKDGGPVNGTQYIDRYFEVREQDQPTKYAWMGNTRVARIEGTLDASAPRVQRLKLYQGWNLIALAVSPQMMNPLGLGTPGSRIIAVYRWQSAHGEHYEEVNAASQLRSGDILWVENAAAGTVAIPGAYRPPEHVSVPAAGGYFGTPWLQVFFTNALPTTATLWAYNSLNSPGAGGWRVRLPPTLAPINDVPPTVPPGTSIFIRPASAFELGAPEASIEYYHQDHLGSSNVLTDETGALVAETTFYPYGVVRNDDRPQSDHSRLLSTHYLFAQNELDFESALQYVAARYRLASVSKFISVDPDANNSDVKSLGRPQLLNVYSYAHNNPLTYLDPSGRTPQRLLVGGDGVADDSSYGEGLVEGYKNWLETAKWPGDSRASSVGSELEPVSAGEAFAAAGRGTFDVIGGDLARAYLRSNRALQARVASEYINPKAQRVGALIDKFRVEVTTYGPPSDKVRRQYAIKVGNLLTEIHDLSANYFGADPRWPKAGFALGRRVLAPIEAKALKQWVTNTAREIFDARQQLLREQGYSPGTYQPISPNVIRGNVRKINGMD